MLDCHAAAAEPAVGPNVEKPARPIAGLMSEAVAKTASPAAAMLLLTGWVLICETMLLEKRLWSPDGTNYQVLMYVIHE